MPPKGTNIVDPQHAKEIGVRLYALRLRDGYTGAQVAAAIGADDSGVYRMEKGTRTPHASHLVALSALYAVSIDWILGVDWEVGHPEFEVPASSPSSPCPSVPTSQRSAARGGGTPTSKGLSNVSETNV